MFRFTEVETLNLLKYFQLDNKVESFKEWYNAYIFGSTTIYNPWSVLSYINKKDRGFRPYWVNTAENLIINNLIAKGDSKTKIDLESPL